ncbi:MAG: acetolactate synthase large subunit [Chloroflexota bacterium]|nr:acetolactate synthase large subunit [Chloroflexota bacterium]
MQEVASTAAQSLNGRLSQAEYGSDLAVELIRSLGIPYVSLNPGASFRGLHDSFVNFAGGGPELVLCCHEEIAIAVAHGYARATGKPMVAAVHDVVGLQHATMGIYHAWCARLPMIVVGGTGPMAAENRRPNTDWLHTALVQGNAVRDYVKWDDQPATIRSIPESILRAHRIATTEPMGPVYVCFDTDLQEEPITSPIELPDPRRFAAPAPMGPDPEALREAAALLAGAQWPVIIAGAVARHREALAPLAELAELLSAPVISSGFGLPANHPLNASANRQEVLRDADVVLALDVTDLFGAFSQTGGIKDRGVFPQYIKPDTKIIHINVWDFLQHSWATDFQRLYPVDVPIAADTQLALPLLVELCGQALGRDSGSKQRVEERGRAVERMQAGAQERRAANLRRGWDSRPISVQRVNAELWNAVQGKPWLSTSMRAGWEITDPEQIAGHAGSGGSSAGLGLAMGTAIGQGLAHRGSGRFLVHTSGDGEFLFTPSTLWTLANLNLPILTVVNNNRLYGNDEGHQEHVARVRERPVENKFVGISLDGPKTDLGALARSFGVEGFGPVEDPAELPGVLARAADIVAREQRPVLVDVITANERALS